MAPKIIPKSPKQKETTFKKPCLGPVADLERHLPSEWWRTLFNSIYLKTDSDVVENAEATTKEVDMVIEYTGIEPNDRVLDLCCGQGRHTLELASRGFRNLSGIDRSRYLIRLGKKRAIEKKTPWVHFKEGDARKIRAESGAFDCVMVMGNSFGYFEREEEDREVIREINRILATDGTIFLDVTCGEWMKQNYSPKSWEWIEQSMLVCRERNLGRDGKSLITREVVIDTEKGVLADQFYAERLYMQEELENLLRSEGFTDVKTITSISGQSTRASPDLGMMANRVIVTGKASQKIAKAPVVAAKEIECVVIMGDPSLPDVIKKNSTWNPEDYETIKRLKDALATIPGYRFSYLNSHKKLITSLLHNPPQFVLNLCDEGYNNEALLELHVPALLEMLKVPYTGAGPQCLGICYNKALVRAIAEDLGVPVPQEILIEAKGQAAAIPYEFPAFVKPSCGDSSMGITQNAVVHCAEDIVNYYDWLKKTIPNTDVLVQEFLSGKEYTVALVGNSDDLINLPILEVDYSKLPEGLPPILGYESKWLPESPYWNAISYKKTVLDDVQQRALVDSCMRLFDRLECRDYARFDFRADSKGNIKLLEVNPNPGWCWDGKFNMMAELHGWSYTKLLEEILRFARERIAIK